MKKVIIFILFLCFTNFTNAQFTKFIGKNKLTEFDIYKNSDNQSCSKFIKFGFKKKLVDNVKGEKKVSEEKVIFQRVKQLFKELRKDYGKLKILKQHPNIMWGDTLKVHRRTKKMVKVVDLSQHYILEFEAPVPIEKVVEKIKKVENILYAEGPLVAELATSPNDPWYYNSSSSGPYRWSFDAINAQEAWDITHGSSNIRVGIHDRFNENIGLHNEISSKVVWESPWNSSGHHGDHGTMSAGIVGASTNNGTDIASIGWNTSLMLAQWGYPYSHITNLVENGADIINCSWFAGVENIALRTEVLRALQQGVIIIASAGNDESSTPVVRYPAAYNFGSIGQVIAVSATEMNGTEKFIEGFNYSPGTNPISDPTNAFIDVSAPGANYRSLSWTSTSGTQHIWSGTSVAAPFVSGTVALMLAVNNSLTPNQVYDILTRTTDKIGQYTYDNNGWNRYMGYGRIDAANAVNVANGAPAKPVNLTGQGGTHPILNWQANTESDLKEYWLYRKTNNGNFYKIATINKTATSYTDNTVTFTKPIWGEYAEYDYKLKAIDNQNDQSIFSNLVHFAGNVIPEMDMKDNDNWQANINIIEEIKSYSVQNYPNPFNPTTLINYQIPKEGHVILKVYNSLGEEVKTLVNENKGIGSYNIEFNASNLPSGMYFYKLQSGEFKQVKKMLLVK